MPKISAARGERVTMSVAASQLQSPRLRRIERKAQAFGVGER